jgi:uncharacterized protein (DUF1684 family)
MRFVIAAIVLLPMIAADAAFESEIASWRKDREARLKAPDGWLSVAGLFWLKPGRTEAGSSSAAIQLPKRAPARAGWFTLEGEQVSFNAAPGTTVIINGKPHSAARLQDDGHGKPDIVEIAGLKLYVIRRGKRLGIRLKDEQSEFRKNFQGLQWYPPRREWLIQARLVPYPQPRKMLFNSQTGDKQEYISPGYAEFEVSGRNYRLTPVNDEGKLFFIFRDKTAGKTTYPAARYLYAELPVNGRVTLDFNKAYNPPCVFTPFATCPLPPPENRLPIEINAGELMYKGKH